MSQGDRDAKSSADKVRRMYHRCHGVFDNSKSTLCLIESQITDTHFFGKYIGRLDQQYVGRHEIGPTKQAHRSVVP